MTLVDLEMRSASGQILAKKFQTDLRN